MGAERETMRATLGRLLARLPALRLHDGLGGHHRGLLPVGVRAVRPSRERRRGSSCRSCPFVIGILRYALLLEEGHGGAPEDDRAGRPPAAGDRRGVVGAVRRRRLGDRVTPSTGRQDRAADGLGADRAHAGQRAPRARRGTTWCDALREAGAAGRDRARPGPQPTATRRRTPAATVLDMTAHGPRARSGPRGERPITVDAGMSLDALIALALPLGLVPAGRARNAARDRGRGDRRRHPRQEPPPRRCVLRPRVGRWSWRRPPASGCTAGPSDEPEVFAATAGGMGLTGVVLARVTLRLTPVRDLAHARGHRARRRPRRRDGAHGARATTPTATRWPGSTAWPGDDAWGGRC